MDLLATARFHDTVVKRGQLKRANPNGLTEVAFVGRSNAGKSTCLNLLCNRRRLAFSSRTPGRTQALNLFAIGPQDAPLGFLVDTPGYGYASAGKEAKQSWQALAGEYMRQGPPLTAVVLLLDIRREITTLDRDLIAWMPAALPLIVVLTKADKLPFGQRRQILDRVTSDPAIAGHPGGARVLLFSATARIGIDEVKAAVCAQFDPTPTPSSPTSTTPIPT